MQSFNLGSLSDWDHLPPGEVLALDVGAAGYRRVDLTLMTDAPVVAVVIVDGAQYPVANGEGLLHVSFGTAEEVDFTVLADKDTNVLLRTKVRSQRVPASDEPSFTSIEPRPSGASDEVRRMMRVMHLNHERRMAELRAEISALQPQQAVERVAEIIERDVPPASVDPAPEAKA